MKRFLASVAAAALCLASPAHAGQYRNPDGSVSPGVVLEQGGKPITPGVQVCGPYTGVLSNLGDTFAMPAACNGYGTYFIHITTAAGDQPFVGTIQATDSVIGSGRRLIKSGVGDLQVSSETLTGTQGVLDYRTTGGPGAQQVTATAYTSGRATVTLYAINEATAPFINGAVDTPEGAALRQGKAFTASTGSQVVTAGQYLSILLNNPLGSGVRLVIPMMNRIVGCNNPSNAALPLFASLPNVATNAPTTAAIITRRGGTSGSSFASVSTANSANKPDTSPSTANPVGLPFFGTYAVPQDRTLEPATHSR